MKKIIKSMLSIIICLVVCCSAFSIESFANNQRPMPAILEYDYYDMTQVVGTERGEDKYTINLSVNSQQVPLYISLPTEGGVRICTEEQGVFKPDAIEKIEYTEDSQGNIKIVAEDGSYFVFRQLDKDWEIEIGKSDEKGLVLKGSELYLGFDNGKVAGLKFIAPLEEDEAIYGTGERYNSINQVGTKLQLWNLDTGYHGADDVLVTKTESYNNIPFIHSTKGYSLFLNSTYCIDADFGVTDTSRYKLKAYGPKFDFYFWTGTPSENIASYTDLTGRAVQLPKWAYSYWAGSGANVWKGSDNGESEYISIVQEYIDGYKKLGINNLVALYGETPITTDKVVYSKLKKNNTRMLMWNPCYTSLNKILDSLKVVESEAPVVYSSVTPWMTSNLSGTNTFIDYSHPSAKQLVKAQYEQYVNWGMRGLMVDMGERVPYDTVFYNGLTGDEMHNLYSYYYAKTINEAFTEMLDGKNDFVLFERSGCAGIQAYAASFTGDQSSRMSGLKQQLNAGLSMSTSGCTIWGGDIGGYGGKPTEDTYMRWIQFATFEPLMREHGNSKEGNAPWFFGAEAEDVFQRFYWLRENMVDTIYSAAINSSKYGSLITTPLMVAYPEQTDLHAIEDEYIFCDNLLVCPVTDTDVNTREVTFPEGIWYDLWNGMAVEGGQTLTAYAPQSTIPVYLKSGALMAIEVSESFDLGQAIDEKTAKKALVVTPPEKDTEYEIWDDEGENSIIYRNNLVSDNTYRISASGEAVDHILAYGTLAETVKVDGVYLPKISRVDTGSYGYYIDGHERTVIILPDGHWENVEISTDSVDVESLKVSDDAVFTDNKHNEETSLLSSLRADDNAKAWVASTTKGTYLQAELDEVCNINNVTLKWGEGYGESYNVEISTDGENFTTVSEVTEQCGGQDVVNFEPTEAKYVRITNIKSGSNYPASVCNLSIFATPDVDDSMGSTNVHVLSQYASKVTAGNLTTLVISIACIAAALVVLFIMVILLVIRHSKKEHKGNGHHKPKANADN